MGKLGFEMGNGDTGKKFRPKKFGIEEKERRMGCPAKLRRLRLRASASP